MCTQPITRDPAECQHSLLHRDLPDEPGGYVCMLSRNLDGCTEGRQDECPVVREVAATCPRCSEPGATVNLLHDEMADLYACPECHSQWWPGELEIEHRDKAARNDREIARRMKEQRMREYTKTEEAI